MNYRGDLALGSTIDIKFTTVNTSGVPTTLAGSPVVSAYVGNGTTEFTTGITLSVDFDGRTGLHNVRVVATSGNTFATATDVSLVLTAGTVGGNSVVGYEVGSFSIENRSGLRSTVAGRTLDVASTGEAGIDWANISGQTTTQNLSGTTVKTATDVETDTADIQTRLPAALVSGRMSSDAVAISGSTTAADNVEANIANLDATVSTRSTQTSVNTIDGRLDTEIPAILSAVDTEVGAIKTVADKLDTALVLDGAVYQYTANALELAPAGGGGGGDASQATLLAVKAKTDALPSDPADASDIAASFTTVNGKLDTIDDFLDAEIAAIKAQTDQLVFTGGKIDANAPITSSDMIAIAQTLLKLDWTTVSGEASYSTLNALRVLRNAWSTAGGTLTVKEEDGSSTAWTRTLGTDPNAEPIVSST